MRTAVISSTELSTKSLRASDYVANPKKIALATARVWTSEWGGMINLKGPAGRRLVELIESAVRDGMKRK